MRVVEELTLVHCLHCFGTHLAPKREGFDTIVSCKFNRGYMSHGTVFQGIRVTYKLKL